MNAMSHRADFIAGSSRVNIRELAFCFTITLLLAVSQVGLPSIIFPTTMSDSKSFNTSVLEVIISSKNKRVFIRDLSDLTLLIIFNAWWPSFNVGSKRPTGWNNSRQASSWRFYLHCGIEETSRITIICIICHQVLRHPSEHGAAQRGQTGWQKLTSQC